MKNEQQLLKHFYTGKRGTVSGTSTDAGHVTDITDMTSPALEFITVENNDGANSIDVEVWITPDETADFTSSADNEWVPHPDFDDGTAPKVSMAAVTLAAGEKLKLTNPAYSSTYKVLVKSSIGGSHGTYELKYEFKG